MNLSDPVDVCIVGGGVAGAIAAAELARHGIETLVLEAGPRHDPSERHEYMRRQLYGFDAWASGGGAENRVRLADRTWKFVTGVGGSGLHWGGNVDRLHESDFKLQSRYGIGVDWPIDYDDLEPYYTRAENLMGVAGKDAYPWTPRRSARYPMEPFPFSYTDRILHAAFERLGIAFHHNPVARNSVRYDGRPPCMSFAMCDTCPVLAKWTPDLLIYRSENTGKVILKPQTKVTRINCNPKETAVESVTAATVENGKPVYREYHARVFMIAAHTFESTRLLLLSKSSAHPHGLGNRSGLLGKYFATHLSVMLNARLDKKTFTERVGFSTSQSHYFYEASREEGGTAFVLYPQNRYVETPFEIVRRELPNQIIWGDALRTRVQGQFGYRVAIQALVEQLPSEENQLSLDENVKDRLGLPTLKLTYEFKGRRESQSLSTAENAIRNVFKVLDGKDVKSKTSVISSHHMGTCRMGASPESSVVDADLKVHGVDNLYVVGSSVFPTFGAVGPTLTIAALAVRLAATVRGVLKRTSVEEPYQRLDKHRQPAVQ